MWNAAGNNLITTAGANQELTVDVNPQTPRLFRVQPAGVPIKITSRQFCRLRGNVLSFLSILFSKIMASDN